MIVQPDGTAVYFDVDDTLVMWVSNDPEREGDISIDGLHLRPHQRHLDLMRYHKERGRQIVVWSAGGSEWARDVVLALGVDSLVDFVMCKPTWAYDDQPADEWFDRKYCPDQGTPPPASLSPTQEVG